MSGTQLALFAAGSSDPTTLPELAAPPRRIPSIRELRERIRTIRDAGYIFHLEVHIWTGQKALKPEDLGLDPQTVSELYSLGRKLLVPKETLRRFHAHEQTARNVLARYGFPFRQDYFVPVTVIGTVVRKLDEIVAEFNKDVERFLERYATVWDEMEPLYREAALKAYRVQRASEPEETYVARFLERIRASYPPAEALRKKFGLRYTFDWPAVPEAPASLSRELARELEERARRALREDLEAMIDQAAALLRERVREACERVARMIREGQVVREQTMHSLRRMVREFRELNFFDDREVERMLQDLEDRYLSMDSKALQSSPAALNAFREALDAVAARAAQSDDVSRVTGWLKRRIIL